MLPDVALLEIFDHHSSLCEEEIEAWHTLVHVCREWRNLVFGSPRRLNLRLCCRAKMPINGMLDIWPPLPIVLRAYSHEFWGEDAVLPVLEHNADRIHEVGLWSVTSSQLKKVSLALRRPLPALTCLMLGFEGEAGFHGYAPDVSASFLGGSAPSLQTLWLKRISFPELPTLLLSATHLVRLELLRIPSSGYISPEAMVTGLSVLTRLETLEIGFKSPLFGPDQENRRPYPPTRTLLPVLTSFLFKGDNKYLEDFVARIDAPLLHNFRITFFQQPVFEHPQLTQFTSRTPKFRSPDKARVVFFDRDVSITFPRTFDGALELTISCSPSQYDQRNSSLALVCGSFFPRALVLAVERLYILEDKVPHLQLFLQDDTESHHWLELLRSFTAVKDLYISAEFAPSIAPFLQELVEESVTEVLPVLHTLFLEETLLLALGPAQEAIEQLFAVRQLAGHPIFVSHWERAERQRVEE